MASPPTPTNVTANVNANDNVSVSWDYDPTWFAFTGDDNSLGGFDEGVWYSEESVTNFEIQLTRDAIGWTDPSTGTINPAYDDSVDSYSETYYPNSDFAYKSQIGIDSMFKFRVRAVNTTDQSSWVTSEKVYTEPLPPHNPSVSRPDANTIELSQTVKSDNLDYTLVYLREDTGSGYGNWELAELMTNETKGSRNSVTMNTTDDMNYRGPLKEDARYQFKLYNKTPNNPNNYRQESKPVYADYGNYENVYFEDDFEDNDLAEWDVVNGTGGSVHSGSGHADLTISGADSGTYYYYGEGNNSTEATYLQKDLGDLSSETDVHIRCAFATASLDNEAEDFGISWYDGSGWQALEHKTWEYNQQGWYELHVTIPDSALATNNKVRIGTTTDDGMYGGDHWAVDRVVVSDILHEYTKPAAPSNPTADNSVQGELTLDWTENTSLSQRSPEWFYRVYGSGNSFTKNFDGPPHTWTDLLDGEKYEWYPSVTYLQPRNGGVDTWWRANGPTTTLITKLPVPDASAMGWSEGGIDVDWVDNSNNDDGFDLYYRKTGNSSWTQYDALLGEHDRSEIVVGLDSNTEYEFRVDTYTEHTTSQSNIASASTFLDATRSTSSYTDLTNSSIKRSIDLLRTETSYSRRVGGTAGREVTLGVGVNSHFTTADSLATRQVNLVADVNSHSTNVTSSAIRVVDVNVASDSYSGSVTSEATTVINLSFSIKSHSQQSISNAERGSLDLENRNSDSSISTINSDAINVIDVFENFSSTVSATTSEADRSGIEFEDRDVDSFVDTILSSTKRVIDLYEDVSSFTKKVSSFTYNKRTSLELISHTENWNDNEAFWYTDWFSETKIREEQDKLGIRSLVVPNAKEPCAIVYLEYDENGDGSVDYQSEPIKLEKNEDVQEVRGVPVSEDGQYRLKITEYSGYNSLYAINTAIVH